MGPRQASRFAPGPRDDCFAGRDDRIDLVSEAIASALMLAGQWPLS
jgi:hypothetical protein